MNELSNCCLRFISRTFDAFLVTILVFAGFAAIHRSMLMGRELLHLAREPYWWSHAFLPVFLIVLIPSLLSRQNRRAALVCSGVAALIVLHMMTAWGAE
jgi:hypothetical protein